MIQYKRNLHEHFIYWEYAGPDDVGGVKVKSPIGIMGKCDSDYQALQERSGETLISRASIITDRPVVEKSYIMAGKIAELSDLTVNPQSIDTAYCIGLYEELLSASGTMRISKARINKR